ncbi:MAG TPA: hypothetical protein PLX83_03615 [bacterium]|nr:hypothetical protein [bacterium]
MSTKILDYGKRKGCFLLSGLFLFLYGAFASYDVSDSYSEGACPSCSSQDVWKDGCGALNQCVDAVVFEELACCYGVNDMG